MPLPVNERSLLVDFDVTPIRLLDSDIFVDDTSLEADVQNSTNFVISDMECTDTEVNIDSDIFSNSLDIEFQVDFGQGGELPWYSGPYIVTPTFEDQYLDTDHKSMQTDVTVKEIPVHEVSNAHGYTLVIGD